MKPGTDQFRAVSHRPPTQSVRSRLNAGTASIIADEDPQFIVCPDDFHADLRGIRMPHGVVQSFLCDAIKVHGDFGTVEAGDSLAVKGDGRSAKNIRPLHQGIQCGYDRLTLLPDGVNASRHIAHLEGRFREAALNFAGDRDTRGAIRCQIEFQALDRAIEGRQRLANSIMKVLTYAHLFSLADLNQFPLEFSRMFQCFHSLSHFFLQLAQGSAATGGKEDGEQAIQTGPRIAIEAPKRNTVTLHQDGEKGRCTCENQCGEKRHIQCDEEHDGTIDAKHAKSPRRHEVDNRHRHEKSRSFRPKPGAGLPTHAIQKCEYGYVHCGSEGVL